MHPSIIVRIIPNLDTHYYTTFLLELIFIKLITFKRKIVILIFYSYNLQFRPVCTKLVSGQSVIAETFSSVSVYFGDIVGFTRMWANSPPLEVEIIPTKKTYFMEGLKNFEFGI